MSTDYQDRTCGECRFYKPNEGSIFLDPDWGTCFPYKNRRKADAKCHKDAKACRRFCPKTVRRKKKGEA